KGTSGQRKKVWAKFALRLLLGLIILALVAYFVEIQQVGEVLLRTNLWYVLAVVVWFYADRGLMAYKWGLLLNGFNIRIPLTSLTRTYITAYTAGVLLPTTIGGDLFRWYNLSRYKIDVKAVAASIFVERFLGVVAAVALAFISLALIFFLMHDSWGYFDEVAWSLLAIVVMGTVGAALLWVILKNTSGRISLPINKIPILGKLRQVLAMCYAFRSQRSMLSVVWVWTFIEQAFSIIVTFLLARALQIDVSILELIAVVPLIILAVRIPISFEGIGVQEGLYVGLLGLVGVPGVEALVLSALTRFVFIGCSLPWGIHFLFSGNRRALDSPQAATS
ncbi:MAG TPA: lysylphosphatidylglycerol synthase transmembrane domain-containing protein, partial [Dehalococcoidia bacterium]|nr:lysylphosphatidylglycerol synthase transmembrane domain-containing protein [Dehalococcoidia bacterium]